MQTIAVITSVKNKRHRLDVEQARGNEGAEKRRNVPGRARDDGRELEADAGQRDDADDDADAGRRGADADRVFRADHEGVEDIEEPRPSAFVAATQTRPRSQSMRR